MPTPSGVDEFDLDKQDSETTAQKEQQQDNPEAATEGEAASAPTAPPDKQTDSDTESIARGDISQPTQPKEGRKTRDRKAKPTQEAPAKIDGDRGLWGGGGPLDQLDEAGSPVKGAGELVPGGAKDNAGKTLSGLTGGGGKRDVSKSSGDDGGKETLRLRLDINLDLELQLKAKINGDLTISLLN